MLQIRTILVPTDRSACAERAYAPAAELAARYGAEIRVVHVSDPGHNVVDVAPLTWDDLADDIRLPAGHDPLAGPIPIEEIEDSHASPALALLDYARDHGVDLVVMGTAGRRGLARFFLGSVAEELVQSAHLPVLTVPCHDAPVRGPVLLPVDYSAGSREALLHGRDLAAERGVALHVVHVVEWPTSPLPYFGGLVLPPLSEVLGRAERDLEAFVAEAVGPGVATTVSTRSGGSVAHSIAAHAREVGAGLVVLYSHQRKGLDRVILGSVSEGVVRMAPCPVLTVRPGHRGLLRDAVRVDAESLGDGGAVPADVVAGR
jgi:nucleotide-binding universal stress UspA family protein